MQSKCTIHVGCEGWGRRWGRRPEHAVNSKVGAGSDGSRSGGLRTECDPQKLLVF